MSANPHRADFPILRREINGHPLTYLDNAATTQKPQAVIDALVDFYTFHNANVHRGVHTLSEEASALYEGAREKVARLIGAKSPQEIIFTRGTTESLNLAAHGWARHALKPGDEIIVSELEHHSNLVPWQRVSAETGAALRYIRVTGQGELDLDDLEATLNGNTRVVALAHTSNVTGAISPLEDIIPLAHDAGAVVVVDGAQGVPKFPIDVTALDCDFLAFSGHKMFAPDGVGVLYGKSALLEATEPIYTGGGMISRVDKTSAQWGPIPARFEAGTPSIADAIGLGAAVDYLNGLDRGALNRDEAALTGVALDALGDCRDITIYGPPNSGRRTGVISFNLDGVHPHDVAEVLDETGVAVRGGHHCCQVLMERLEVQGVVRASLALYNDLDDITRLLEGLHRVRKVFGNGNR